MIDRDAEMFGYGVASFCDLVATTAADDPPGAIAAAAVAVAVAAALAEKCTDGAPAAELREIRAAAFAIAVDDAGAYREWRDGATESPAIEDFPRRLARAGERVAEIARALPPEPLTGDTDLRSAAELAVGGARAADAVAAGNLGRG